MTQSGTVKITADEGLFNEWQRLGVKVAALSTIVQNDMVLHEHEVEHWENTVRYIVNNIDEAVLSTKRHIDDCNPNKQRERWICLVHKDGKITTNGVVYPSYDEAYYSIPVGSHREVVKLSGAGQ